MTICVSVSSVVQPAYPNISKSAGAEVNSIQQYPIAASYVSMPSITASVKVIRIALKLICILPFRNFPPCHFHLWWPKIPELLISACWEPSSNWRSFYYGCRFSYERNPSRLWPFSPCQGRNSITFVLNINLFKRLRCVGLHLEKCCLFSSKSVDCNWSSELYIF